MKVALRPIAAIRPYEQNPRHNDAAVDAVAESIREFGFRQPIVVDSDGVIVIGHTRYKAALKLGLEKIPVHVATDLSPEQVAAYRILDNRTHELSAWDDELLARLSGEIQIESEELQRLIDELISDAEAELHKNGPALKPISTRTPPSMVWVLIGIPTIRFVEISDEITRIAQHEEIICEVTSGDQPKDR